MGRRKKKHEDHINHEAWAIPYGDLITLLLAFFVVMYAISSVNAGKFRVLSDSLNAAFRGSPTTFEPVQIGERTRGTGADLGPRFAGREYAGDREQCKDLLHVFTPMDVRSDGPSGPAKSPWPGRHARSIR